jgi:transposase InsO family protein
MTSVEPVDPRVRLAIVQWPGDAPRGAVSAFCAECGISRKTFYAIRRRAAQDGPDAALEPRSRRPSHSPSRLSEQSRQDALRVRVSLEQSGLDFGPVSVFERMRVLGMEPVPSVASLARIFRAAGVARVEPKKKPRAAYRRFVYPAPNACWQLDATEYVLAGGRKCVIFQLIDDHSRLAVASHVAWSETADAALAVVKKGIRACGVPQRLLSDNGVALNPSRRGFQGRLVTFLTSLGVTPITGKPGKPTTQGKNERFHQTLFRWLDKQPLAGRISDLQAQVDTFDRIYNTERPHQGLPGRITPKQAWDATEVASAPKPKPPTPPDVPSYSSPRQSVHTVDGVRTTKVRNDGTVRVRKIEFCLGAHYAGQIIHVISGAETVTFVDLEGVVIADHPWPLPGVSYVGAKQLRRPKL